MGCGRQFYILPHGKVPRNKYVIVELFKPWMMPVGCVQIPINEMYRVLRQTKIDTAPAMVGWDFSGMCVSFCFKYRV